MNILLGVFIFLLGLIIGSFLNVLALRHHTGRGLGGRSTCPACDTTLRTADLVPLLSYLMLRGRCRYCAAGISAQYPLVELASGFIFLGLFYRFGLPLSIGAGVEIAAYATILSLYLAIVVYDVRHHIIPDAFSYLAGGVAFALLFLSFAPLSFAAPSLLALAAGPAVALPLFAFWFFSGGRWMGLGDAKLALSIGWLVGFAPGLSALILSFWIGAVVSLAFVAASRSPFRLWPASKRLTIKSEIPFAPFLVAGALLVFFFSIDVLSLTEIFI